MEVCIERDESGGIKLNLPSLRTGHILSTEMDETRIEDPNSFDQDFSVSNVQFANLGMQSKDDYNGEQPEVQH